MNKGVAFVLNNCEKTLKLVSEVEKYKHLKPKVVREYYYLKSIKYTGNMYEHYLKYKNGNHKYAKDFEFLDSYGIISNEKMADYLKENYFDELNNFCTIDDFIIGNIYSNNEIASTFKCSNMGGMRRSIATNSMNELLSNEIVKNNTKKILMIYSNLLGEGESKISNSLAQINNLKAISFGCTYFDYIDLTYCKENNIVVTTLPDYRAELRADLIVYIMQTLQGNIAKYIKNLKENKIGMFPSISLLNKKVGIIGLTEIGTSIANKCNNLGMKVSYYSENKRNPKYEFKDIKNIFKESDFIITASYPGEEQYYINEDIVSEINPNAYIVSCEQGGSNVNEVLFKQLAENRKIRGFGFYLQSLSLLS